MSLPMLFFSPDQQSLRQSLPRTSQVQCVKVLLLIDLLLLVSGHLNNFKAVDLSRNPVPIPNKNGSHMFVLIILSSFYHHLPLTIIKILKMQLINSSFIRFLGLIPAHGCSRSCCGRKMAELRSISRGGQLCLQLTSCSSGRPGQEPPISRKHKQLE